MVSLGISAEVGSVIGGTLDPSVAVPLAQEDLVVVTLPLQNQTQLNAFLQSVSDPSSPSYGDYLTSAQFSQMYGPTVAVQLGVLNYLASNGLQVDEVSSDHLTVAAQGTLQQIEQAFLVSFSMYTKGGQTFFAPSSPPSVPESLAPWILNVVGLTNYNVGFHPEVLYDPALSARGEQSNGPGVGVMDYPNQMPYEYQLNPLWNATGNRSAGVVPSFPKGVVIATALWDLNTSAYCPYSLTDIGTFFNGTTNSGVETRAPGFPAPIDLANYNITGAPTYGPGTGNCAAGVSQLGPTTASEELDFEMTIDQEYSGENAPGAVIEPTYVGGFGVTNGVNNANLELLLAWLAEGNVPNLDVLSQSFGGNESTNFEPYYTELAAEGVTVSASSGDNNGACGPGGPTACSGNTVCDTGSPPTQYSWDTFGTPTVDYPGSSPNVLAVGGTANMAFGTPGDPGAILPGQTVWNWCPTFNGGLNGGSTGGVSSLFTEPSYQSSVPIVNKAMEWASKVFNTGNFTNGLLPTGCEGCNDNPAATPTARAVPDLAGPAADMTGYMAGSWVTGYGGTSFSSPSVAGMIGSIIAFDGHKVGFINTALYQLEQEYLDGAFAGLPFPVAPTYYVQNYSNAFFNGATDYNTSAGWGVPQAYNIALLLGKPFISTNPTGPASVGSTYPVAATVQDDRSLSTVNVSYLEPGGSWRNSSLKLSSGTPNSGTWTGAIPAPAQAGVLEYCIDAVDVARGNSWSPYNESAWVATGGKNTTPGAFGCTVPFKVTVHATYPVIFTESGLASGTTWSATLNGNSESSTTTAILFSYVPNGTYGYTVGSVPGYSASPASGTVTMSGGLQVVSISFTPIPGKYTVTFTESGLPTGTSWSVSLGGTLESSTTATIVFSGIGNGSYSYSVGSVAGYTSNPSSAPVTVRGATDSLAITFAPAGTRTYSVTFAESGLPPGTSWSVTLNGAPETSTGGTGLFAEPNGTYSYSVGKVAGYSAAPSSGSVRVSGALVKVAVAFSRASSPACGSVASAIPTNFNGQAIASGSYVWFSSVLQWTGKSPATSVTVTFGCQTITFPSGSGIGPLYLPAASVTFSPNATRATTVFSTSTDSWVTTVPASFSSDVFLSGFAFPAPSAGVPGGLHAVSWSGGFSGTGAASAKWQWGAAVYSIFSQTYNALGVKPAHSSQIDAYPNSDPAGTPENYTSYLVAGATGGGGSNYTGTYSNSAKVKLAGQQGPTS